MSILGNTANDVIVSIALLEKSWQYQDRNELQMMAKERNELTALINICNNNMHYKKAYFYSVEIYLNIEGDASKLHLSTDGYKNTKY